MTSERDTQLQAFLTLSGWAKAPRSTLAGDASNRRYDRLDHPELGRAVLMDAPPSKGEDTRPFIKIATHLRNAGLSAPQIIARDTTHGFLIIEDLGDDLFARVLERDPAPEHTLYIAATDALKAAQDAAPPQDLHPYGAEAMAQTGRLAADWYLKFTTPDAPDIGQELQDRLRALLTTHLTGPEVLVQRDYHAENLLWLPQRDGPARVGLLDFQDAMLGHPAYDLASLLKDARRDVDPVVQQACIDHFITQTGADPYAFKAAYAACSAQRNLRIVGVFARLCIRDGKPHYPDLLPRVWANLISDFEHPALQEFGTWVTNILPPPTPQIIARIKASHV